jgi:hypothetical protein
MSSVWAQKSCCRIENYVEDQIFRSDASSAEYSSSILDAVETQLQPTGHGPHMTAEFWFAVKCAIYLWIIVSFCY